MKLSAFVVSAVVFTGIPTPSDSELAALRTWQQRTGLPPASRPGSVGGRVADIKGQAIPGVTVTAIPETGGPVNRTETGRDGTYQIGGLAPGSYRIDFELLGFDLARRNHVHVTDAPATRADTTMRISGICECVTRVPERPLRERAGQVLSESGDPLPHARLHIGSPWSEVRYADGDGRFVVRLPLDGRAPLTASSSGFRPVTEQVSGSPATPVVFRLVPDRSADVADSEQLTRPCCPGDLFTHAGR